MIQLSPRKLPGFSPMFRLVLSRFRGGAVLSAVPASGGQADYNPCIALGSQRYTAFAQ